MEQNKPYKTTRRVVERNLFVLLDVVRCSHAYQSSLKGKPVMDKDRVKGAVQQIKGAVKEIVGKVTGDAKLKAEGQSDKVAGKMQNAAGGVKDALRGK
jgi:uncharacterized protein YjbJ (UPF0337 family)